MKATYFAVLTVQFPTRAGGMHMGTYSHVLEHEYTRGEPQPTRRALFDWTIRVTLGQIGRERPSWDIPTRDELAVLFYACEEEIR